MKTTHSISDRLSIAECDAIVLCGGRVVDPYTNRDEQADIAVVDGKIANSAPSSARRIDVSGCIVCPGLMDIHVHLREPGQTHKETIETGTAAAAAGGFTFVACMPNTKPPLDQPQPIRSVLDRAREVNLCEVGPVAAITRDRAGKTTTDFAALLEAGAVAFSDDGTGVESDPTMRAAFEQALEHDAVLIQHCEYTGISAGGVMHAGEVSAALGLPGLDPDSEEAMIARDIALCGEIGGRYHVAHISTAKAVDLVHRAKAEGVGVTAEVCTHHLVLDHHACRTQNTNTKMHPPLRTEADVAACRQGLLDGTIDCIVTDHAPHTHDEKAKGFLQAPPGIVGLETAIGLASHAMIESGLADWPALVAWLTRGPAGVLGRRPNPITAGITANLTLIDPHERWRVDPDEFFSKGRSTPFAGWELLGRSIATIRGRRLIGRSGELACGG